jgi:hypothetical protein
MIFWAYDIFGPAGGRLLKEALNLGVPLLVGLAFSAVVYRYFSLPILKYGRARKTAQK